MEDACGFLGTLSYSGKIISDLARAGESSPVEAGREAVVTTKRCHRKQDEMAATWVVLVANSQQAWLFYV